MDAPDALMREAREITCNDPAHDWEHTMRVYRNAQKLCDTEDADRRLVLSAVLLHDIVSYPKSDPRSADSAIHSAQKAEGILRDHGFGEEEIRVISEAIRQHSFSQNQRPSSIEGRILQDADRLDALGAIGIARVFATGGSIGRPFYDPGDPFCEERSPDDRTWTLDHFYKKLLKLRNIMNTESGRAEAARRTRVLESFLAELRGEI